MIKEHKFFVKGMHCASCEILIEKKLLKIKGIKSVEASVGKEEVLLEYENKRPTAGELNQIFAKEGCLFSDQPIRSKNGSRATDAFKTLTIAILLIVGFVLLDRSGLTGLVNVNSQSSLPIFFVFGLLAGVSSCAALVGGMILSLAKQWAGQKFQPHLLFNAGRLISYAVLGAVLGLIGSRLQFSLTFSSILVIGVSLLMAFLGFQMFGISALRRFQFTLPKVITRKVAFESNFKGKWLPFLMGAGTFFLPCGFTITTQGLALLSGSPLRAGLMMLVFALGTLPMLLLIGLSSSRLYQNHRWSENFTKTAGVLVIFFALYNINSQLNLLGLPSFNDVGVKSSRVGSVNREDLLVPVGGKQIIKMNASASGYQPNYFKVRAGVPVRWEITDTGTSGCTNAVISRGLFEGQIDLTPGKVSVKEFTPAKPGEYKFSCWMGMISGTVEVVGKNGQVEAAGAVSLPSGVSGCGCCGGGK